MSEQEKKKIEEFKAMMLKEGELSDDDLEQVSGGFGDYANEDDVPCHSPAQLFNGMTCTLAGLFGSCLCPGAPCPYRP